MDLGILVSLLGLLLAMASFALDVVALVITTRKEKRPRHLRPPPSF
jgi:hypothetical protein